MKLRRIIIAGVLLDLAVGAVLASTVIVGPDPCPLPADAPLYIAGADVEADIVETRLKVAQPEIVIYERRRAGWAGRRLFAWFHPGSSETTGDSSRVDQTCAAEPAAAQ